MNSRSQEISSSFSSNTTPKQSESMTVNSPSYFSSPQFSYNPTQRPPFRSPPTHITHHVRSIQVPKLYVARIQQLKRELDLNDEGEVIYWLMKQSEQLDFIKHINVPMINQPTTLFAPSTRHPTQVTPMRALPPQFSQTDTESIEIPEIYFARIMELKIKMNMENEGEVIHWLLKEAKESIMACTGTGTMPILFSSSSNEANQKNLFSQKAVLVNDRFRAKPHRAAIMRAANAYPCDESSPNIPYTDVSSSGRKLERCARMRAINDYSLIQEQELKKAKSTKKN